MLELNVGNKINRKKKLWVIVVNGKRSNPWEKAVHNDSPHVTIALFFFQQKTRRFQFFVSEHTKKIYNLLPFFHFIPPTSSLLFLLLQQNGAITGLVQKVLHLFEGL